MLATPRTGAAAAAGLGLNGAGYLEIKGSVLMEQELPHWKQAEAYEPREEVFDGLDSSGKPTTKTASPLSLCCLRAEASWASWASGSRPAHQLRA